MGTGWCVKNPHVDNLWKAWKNTVLEQLETEAWALLTVWPCVACQRREIQLCFPNLVYKMSNRKLSIPKPWFILFDFGHLNEMFILELMLSSTLSIDSTDRDRSISVLLTSHKENLLTVGTSLSKFQSNPPASSHPSLYFLFHQLSFFFFYSTDELWHFVPSNMQCKINGPVSEVL